MSASPHSQPCAGRKRGSRLVPAWEDARLVGEADEAATARAQAGRSWEPRVLGEKGCSWQAAWRKWHSGPLKGESVGVGSERRAGRGS